MQPEVDRSERVALGHEACTYCRESSKRTHPAGVIVGGNWRCGMCLGWQLLPDAPLAPDKEDAREEASA